MTFDWFMANLFGPIIESPNFGWDIYIRVLPPLFLVSLVGALMETERTDASFRHLGRLLHSPYRFKVIGDWVITVIMHIIIGCLNWVAAIIFCALLAFLIFIVGVICWALLEDHWDAPASIPHIIKRLRYAVKRDPVD